MPSSRKPLKHTPISTRNAQEPLSAFNQWWDNWYSPYDQYEAKTTAQAAWNAAIERALQLPIWKK